MRCSFKTCALAGRTNKLNKICLSMDSKDTEGEIKYILFITHLDAPGDPRSVKKMPHYPLNLNLEDWCSNIEPKTSKNPQKLSKMTDFC